MEFSTKDFFSKCDQIVGKLFTSVPPENVRQPLFFCAFGVIKIELDWIGFAVFIAIIIEYTHYNLLQLLLLMLTSDRYVPAGNQT